MSQTLMFRHQKTHKANKYLSDAWGLLLTDCIERKELRKKKRETKQETKNKRRTEWINGCMHAWLEGRKKERKKVVIYRPIYIYIRLTITLTRHNTFLATLKSRSYNQISALCALLINAAVSASCIRGEPGRSLVASAHVKHMTAISPMAPAIILSDNKRWGFPQRRGGTSLSEGILGIEGGIYAAAVKAEGVRWRRARGGEGCKATKGVRRWRGVGWPSSSWHKHVSRTT